MSGSGKKQLPIDEQGQSGKESTIDRKKGSAGIDAECLGNERQHSDGKAQMT